MALSESWIHYFLALRLRMTRIQKLMLMKNSQVLTRLITVCWNTSAKLVVCLPQCALPFLIMAAREMLPMEFPWSLRRRPTSWHQSSRGDKNTKLAQMKGQTEWNVYQNIKIIRTKMSIKNEVSSHWKSAWEKVYLEWKVYQFHFERKRKWKSLPKQKRKNEKFKQQKMKSLPKWKVYPNKKFTKHEKSTQIKSLP